MKPFRNNEVLENELKRFPKFKMTAEQKGRIQQRLQTETGQQSIKKVFGKAGKPLLALCLLSAFVFGVTYSLNDQKPEDGLPNGGGNGQQQHNPGPAVTHEQSRPDVQISDFIDSFKGVTPLYGGIVGRDNIPKRQKKAAIAGLIADAAASMGRDGKIRLPVNEDLNQFFNVSPEQLRQLKGNRNHYKLGGNEKFKWTRIIMAKQLSNNQKLTTYLQQLTMDLEKLMDNRVYPDENFSFKRHYEKYASISKRIIKLDRAIRSVTHHKWKVSSVFKPQDGVKMRGIPEKVAFSVPNRPLAANNPVDLTWQVQNENFTISGNIQVVAENKKTGRRSTLIEEYIPREEGSKMIQFTTSVIFPSGGLWGLDVYVRSRQYGRIVVDVKN